MLRQVAHAVKGGVDSVIKQQIDSRNIKSNEDIATKEEEKLSANNEGGEDEEGEQEEVEEKEVEEEEEVIEKKDELSYNYPDMARIQKERHSILRVSVKPRYQ